MERSPWWESVVGALLGPEGADPCPGFRGGGRCLGVRAGLVLVPLCPLWGVRVWRGRWAGVWLVVENCTVDASIFSDPLFCAKGV